MCVVVHNCAPTFILHSLLSGYLTVCYLSICSSCYLQLLSSVFEGRALDLIFFYIDLTKNSDVRLAFEALKVCVCFKQIGTVCREVRKTNNRERQTDRQKINGIYFSITALKTKKSSISDKQ